MPPPLPLATSSLNGPSRRLSTPRATCGWRTWQQHRGRVHPGPADKGSPTPAVILSRRAAAWTSRPAWPSTLRRPVGGERRQQHRGRVHPGPTGRHRFAYAGRDPLRHAERTTIRAGLRSSGNLWVTNDDNNTVVEFTPAQLAASGSPTPAVTLSANEGSLAGHTWPSTAATCGWRTMPTTPWSSSPRASSAPAAPTPAVTLSATAYSLDNDLAGLRPFGRPVGGEHRTAPWSSSPRPSWPPPARPRRPYPLGGGTSLNSPDGLAFDSSGDLWVTNLPNNTVVEFTSAQLAVTGSPTPTVILSAMLGAWTTQPAWPSTPRATCGWRTLTTTPWSSSARPAVDGLPHAGGDPLGDDRRQPGQPAGLAFDAAGDLWVANYNNNTLVEFTPAQLAATGSPTPAVTLSATGNSLGGRRPGLQLRRRPVGGQQW